MPKKLWPTVDFMAFKCRTLRVNLSGGRETNTIFAASMSCGDI